LACGNLVAPIAAIVAVALSCFAQLTLALARLPRVTAAHHGMPIASETP
jgi:hypothetical protein